MNFYFCETCGKRVTDIDLHGGKARDKKLKGVYCSNCAVGVMTVELDAIQLPVNANDPHGRQTADMPAVESTERPPRVGSQRIAAVGRTPKFGDTTRAAHATHSPHTHATTAKGPSRSETEQNRNNVMLASVVSIVILLSAVTYLIFNDHSKSVADAPKNTSAKLEERTTAQAAVPQPAPPLSPATTATTASVPPATVETPHTKVDPAPKTKIDALDSTAIPVSTEGSNGGLLGAVARGDNEDIRESLAKRKLDSIDQLLKEGKAAPAKLRELYTEIAEGSYGSTVAGKEAAERLKKLPPPEIPVAPPPAPAAIISGVSQPTPGATAIPAATGVTPQATLGKGVWWEGEDTAENNFVAHSWLDFQLDPKGVSGGHMLNHMDDPNWFKALNKVRPSSIHASYNINVPVDGVYTLWAREYDPFCSVLWKFKFDSGAFFTVPQNYPYENKVEVSKDRSLVWRNYPNQKLSKGKHVFTLEASIEPGHGLAGFDCFYLTTGAFKPDGTTKP